MIITAIQKENGPKHTTNLAQLPYGTRYVLPKVIFQMPIRSFLICKANLVFLLCKKKSYVVKRKKSFALYLFGQLSVGKLMK